MHKANDNAQGYLLYHSIGLYPGKEADLVILEQDPFKVAPDEIMNIKISETWVGGEQTFG